MRKLTIKKERGAVDFSAAQRTLANWLQTCANGTYTLTMKREQQLRTNPQNNLMWLWFTTIAREWSDASSRTFTAQDVHDAYTLLFLPKDTPKGKVSGSTKELNTEQMTAFLDQVQADAATEYGITLPTLDDVLNGMVADKF